MSKKQYGLILPQKNKGAASLQTRILNPLQDSDDELQSDEEGEESPLNWIEASLKRSSGNAGQKATQRRILQEALKEDSSVFQYDEVYNDIKSKQDAQQAAKKKKDKPKYIDTILKTAEKRKLNLERQKERKVQKEREAEGDEFADKESFVTASYLKKLEELKQAELEERKQNILEEKNDLLKHKNFSAFYSHIYQQKLGDVSVKSEPPDPEENTERHSDDTHEPPPSEENKPSSNSPRKRRHSRKSNSSSTSPSARRRKEHRDDERSLSRSPRRRKDTREDESRSSAASFSQKKKDKTRRIRNIRDRDSNSDDERPSERRNGSKTARKTPARTVEVKRETQSSDDSDSPKRKGKKESGDQSAKSTNTSDIKIEKSAVSDLKTKEQQIERLKNLFVKRTQGEVFDAAVSRYFNRVSQKNVQCVS